MIAGTLEIQMLTNLAKLQSDMDAAKASVTSTMGAIESAVGIAQKAILGLAAGMTVGHFAGMIQGAIEAQAELKKMSDRTGATVESLSALKGIAKRTQTDFEQVGGALQKLSKSMTAAESGTGAQADAFRRLGISGKELAAGMDDPGKMLLTVAQRLNGFGDGARKNAIEMDLFSEAGANLAPMLKELATQTELVGKVTSSQAEDAQKFVRLLAQWGNQGKEVYSVIAGQITPALNSFLETMLGKGGILKDFVEYVKELAKQGKIKEWAEMAKDGILALMNAVAPAIKITGAYFALFVAAPAAFAAASAATAAAAVSIEAFVGALVFGEVGLLSFNKALWGTSVQAELAAGSLSVLKLAGSVLFAAFAGWEIGSYLSQQFVEVRVAGLMMVGGLMQAWEAMKYGFDTAVNGMQTLFFEFVGGIGAAISKIPGMGDAGDMLTKISTTSLAAIKTDQDKLTASYKATTASIEQTGLELAAWELANDGKVTASKKAAADTRQQLGAKEKEDFDKTLQARFALQKAAAEAEKALQMSVYTELNAQNEAYHALGLIKEQEYQDAKLRIKNQELDVEQAMLQAQAQAAQSAMGAATKDVERLKFATQLLEIGTKLVGVQERRNALDWAYWTANQQASEKSRAQAQAKEDQIKAADEAAADAASRYENGIKESNSRIEFENSLLGESNTMRTAALALYDIQAAKEKQILEIKKLIASDEQKAAQIARVEAAASQSAVMVGLQQQRAAAMEYVTFFEGVSHNLWDDFTSGSADAGKKAWESIKRELFDQIYKAFVQKYVINVIANVAGVTGGETGGMASQVAGLGSSMFGAGGLSGAASGGAGWVTGATTLSGSLEAGASLMALDGGFAAGAAMIGGAMLPVVAGLAALSSILGEKSFETKYGGAFDMQSGGAANKLYGPGTGGEFADQFAQKLMAATDKGINDLFTKIGSTTRLSYLTAGAESSQEGQGFSFAGAKLSTGQSVGQFTSDNNRGNKTPEEAAKALVQEMQQVTLQALQAATDIPKSIADKLAGINIDGLSSDALAKLTVEVSTIITNVADLQVALGQLPFESLQGLSFDAAAALIEFSGGIDALKNNLSGYYQNYFSVEEQRAQTIINITKTLTDAGVDLAAFGDMAKAGRDALRAAVNDTANSGAQQQAALLSVQAAYASITPALDSAATATRAESSATNDAASASRDYASAQADAARAAEQAAAAIASERAGLQDQLDALTMTSAELLAKQRNALDASNRALFDQIQAQKDLKQAADDAAQAQADYAIKLASRTSTQLGILAQIADVTGNKVMAASVLRRQRDAEIADMMANGEVGTALLTQRLWGLQDAAQAAADAANAQAEVTRALAAAQEDAAKLQNDRLALQSQLYELNGDSAAAKTVLDAQRAISLAALAPSLRELQTQVWGLQDAASVSAKSVASAAQALDTAKTNASEAMATVQRAVDAQRKIYQVQVDAAKDAVTEIKSVFDVLHNSVKDLYQSVASTNAMQANDARVFIGRALSTAQSTGYLPESKQLTEAINAAKGDSRVFVSQFEQDFARLTLAGDLSQLEAISKTQLTEAERTLRTAEDQLKSLDGILETAQKQLDAANGLNTSVLSVGDAVANLGVAISALAGATAAAKQAPSGGSGAWSATGDNVTAAGRSADVVLSAGDSAMLNAAKVVYKSALEGVSSDIFNAAQAAVGGDIFTAVGWTGDPNALRAKYSFAQGINYLPSDMVIQAHEGERIMPAADNRELMARLSSPQQNNDAMVAELRAVKAELVRLQELMDDGNTNTKRTAEAVNGQPDRPMLVEVSA